uniref:KUP/HAK/KT family potassium transporter n=1 Tax=Hymenobacter sp. TaxID=1898978 RepID=UPI00286AE1F1
VEALRLNFWPKVRISYPTELRGQSYVASLNWLLCAGCIGVVLYFRESGKMEAAFGLAVTITMLMTTLLLAYYLRQQRTNPALRWLIVGTYLVVEGAYLVANLRKFPEGGWLSVLLSVIILVVIVSWIQGQKIRRDLTEFVPVADWLPLLQTLSNDTSVSKYATHLVYLTKSTDSSQIENGIIHSIFKKNPKRADLYYFVHVHTDDDPYTRTFHVEHIVPQELVRIDFRLGFRVDHAINYMFRQVVTDLVRNKEIDITSRYESLREQDIVGDFQFVLLNKTLPYERFLRGWKRVALRLHNWLKWLGVSDQESFGLDNSTFTVENVPLQMPARPELELTRD